MVYWIIISTIWCMLFLFTCKFSKNLSLQWIRSIQGYNTLDLIWHHDWMDVELPLYVAWPHCTKDTNACLYNSLVDYCYSCYSMTCASSLLQPFRQRTWYCCNTARRWKILLPIYLGLAFSKKWRFSYTPRINWVSWEGCTLHFGTQRSGTTIEGWCTQILRRFSHFILWKLLVVKTL